MAIARIFGGTSIVIPGAFDTKNVLLTGAAPSVAVGKIAIIGEAAKGRPGSVEILQFSPAALQDLINEYGSGQIVDAARVLTTPSNDGRLANGASAIYVYKTNNSTRSTLALLPSGYATARSLEYGQEANLISMQVDKNNTTNATTVSSATFDETAISATGTFTLRESGGAANLFSFSGAPTNNADLQAQLDNAGNWSGGLPTETTLTVGGADGISTLTISTDALATDHQLGAGRGFELLDGTNTPLATMNLSDGLQQASLESSVRLVISRQTDGTVEDTDDNTGDLGGAITMNIGYEGTTATMTINSTALQTTVTGGSGASLNLTLSNFTTISDLVAFINTQTGYTCTLEPTANGGLDPTTLDRVSAEAIASSGSGLTAGKIKSDAFVVFDYVRRNSSLIEILNTGTRLGLPDPLTQTFLSGAIRGSSSTSSFTAALTAFEDIEDIDIIVPLVSQDASDDLAEDAGSTDVGSTYDVESVHIATRNHCKKMSSTQERKERVCYLGFRGTFTECKTQALTLNSEFASLLIQDVSVGGTDGNLFFAQPHIAASICAGMQAGGDIGQPTTKKLITAAAVQHLTKQGVAPSSSEEFKPSKTQEAINNGILPLKAPSSGGVEIVVQNATYNKDNNFVFNRPSVFSAVNFIARTMRKSLEDKFVGTKNLGTATQDAIESEIDALMADFKRSEIIVGDDSNGGIGYKDLNVRIEGNAILIDITITPVQGIDFIFTNIAIDNIRVAA